MHNRPGPIAALRSQANAMSTTSVDASSSSADKLIGLELIRFVCACAILFWHYKHFAFEPDGSFPLDNSRQPFYSAFRVGYDHGFYGVQIFWCISGYIFFWKYSIAIAQRRLGLRTFLVLRFSRLYPLHVATLFLVLAMQFLYFHSHGYYFVYQFNDVKHFAAQLLLASSWGLTDGDSFNGPIWSISVEVLVYLMFFLLLRLFGYKWIVTVAILVLSVAATLLNISNTIVECVAFFYMGGLSASARLTFERISRTSRWCAVVAFAMLIFLPATILGPKFYLYRHFTFCALLVYSGVLLGVLARNYRLAPSMRGVSVILWARRIYHSICLVSSWPV
jgi:peptidoglycan/LPS O-acetylase OafA/YrhL